MVVVVGGGITGLAAAWELSATPGRRVVVLEASDRLGGKLRTSPFAGLPAVDEGPDAFLARVPEAVALCRELGLGDDLVSPSTGKAWLWWGHRLHGLPAGLVLGVPSDLAGLARSRLLSWPAKARAAIEPVLPGLAARVSDDNLGALVRARFGDQVLERLVDPLVGGINAGDADHLSAKAAAPQILGVAGSSRSLLFGLRRQAAKAPANPGPVFLAPTGGMGSIVERLVAGLQARGVELRTGVAVAAVEPAGSQWTVADVTADAVIVATPAFVAAPQLAAISADAARLLGAIPHASVAMVTLAYRDADVGRPLDGSGHLVPKPAQRALTACSWASTKWAHWKLPGQAVLRASLGRFGNEAAAHGTDDELVASAVADLTEPLALRADPTAVRVTRWDRAFPQHTPGHLERVAEVEAALRRDAPGVWAVGAAHRGVGIPACIRQGRAAARDAMARLADTLPE